MSRKPIYVVKPSLPPIKEYIDEISDIWESGIMTHSGPKFYELKEKLEQYFKVDNVDLFANGHLALELGIASFGLSGEVITTPFTFASTTQAILRNNLKPVFCDINKDDFTIDCSKIEELINENTVAIVATHVYGNICDVEKIDDIAQKYNLKVIYDGAHAFGVKFKGKSIACYGDMTMFSFHATKVFNTVEGGCLTFSNKYSDRLDLLYGLKQFGQRPKSEETPFVGTNAKMTEIHAAMGLCNLNHIDEYIAKRKIIVNLYRERLSSEKGLCLSVEQKDVEHNGAYFPVIVKEEETGVNVERIIDALADNNIIVRRYFHPLCSDFEIIKQMGIDADVPVAQYISDRVITLPLFSDLSLEDANTICDIILQLYC